MFFVPAILAKKGPLAVVWLAAHMQNKLTKSQILQTDIEAIVDMLSGNGEVQLSLRVTCDLLVGVCLINKRQIDYALADATRKLKQLQQWITGAVVQKKRTKTIDLPDRLREELGDWSDSFEQIHQLDQLMQDFALEMPPPVFLNEEDLARRRRAVTMEEVAPQPVDDSMPLVDNFGKDPFVGSDIGFFANEDDEEGAPQQPPPPVVSQDESAPFVAPDDDYPPSAQTKRPRLESAAPDASPALSTAAAAAEGNVLPASENLPLPHVDSLVLPSLSNAQIAEDQIRGPGRGRGRGRRGIGEPPIRRRRLAAHRQLIFDEVYRISDGDFAAQLQPPQYEVVPEFAPNLGAFRLALTGDVNTMFNRPLRSLPTQLRHHFTEAIEGARHREPVEEEEEEEAPVEQAPGAAVIPMEVDQSDEHQQQPPPPLDFEDATFFDEPIPPAPDVTAQPPIDDDGDNEGDSSLHQQRRQAAGSRLDQFEDLDDEMTQSDFKRTIDETIAQLGETDEMAFSALLGSNPDRKTAALTFLSLLQRANQGEVKLRQRSSYQQFNSITVFSTMFDSLEI